MPRVVRNFWISGSVDGVKKAIGVGPEAADGGFSLEIRIREGGEISDKVIRVSGEVFNDNKLRIDVEGPGFVHFIETER